MKRVMQVSVSAMAIAGAATSAVLAFPSPPVGNSNSGNGSSGTTPTVVRLAGVVRDFRAANVRDGHPDFGGAAPIQGRAVYPGIAADQLNTDGDPAFVNRGHKATTLAHDGAGRCTIGPKPYLTARSGDTSCTMLSADGGAVTSAASFSDWYRDNALVNMSAPFEIPLTPTSTGLLRYDGDLRTQFAGLPGFGGNKVFGYTFEIECMLRVSGQEQFLTFGADDAVWVYINGKLVVDLGGNHDYCEQVIDVSRVQGLTAGQSYSMKIFYAERDKTNSRFRMETTGTLTPIDPPPTSSHWD